MKHTLPFLLLLFSFLFAEEEVDALRDKFIQSHLHPDASGMKWDPTHPHGSPDWFTMDQPGVATLEPAGPKGFRFLLVDVEIGEEKLLALVDTGAGVSLLSLSAAVRIGAHPAGPVIQGQRGVGFGGTTRMILSRIPEIRLGGVAVRNARVSVIPQVADLPLLPPVGGRKVDMLIGYDMLRAFNWVEFARSPRRLRLGAGASYEGEAPASVPLLAVGKGGPRVEARVGGASAFPVTLDTGGNFGLRLPEKLADQMGVRRRDLISPPRKGVSVGGRSATVKGEKVTLSLGPLTLANLPTHLNVGDGERADKIGALLGHPVLSRLRWILDHDGDRVILFP